VIVYNASASARKSNLLEENLKLYSKFRLLRSALSQRLDWDVFEVHIEIPRLEKPQSSHLDFYARDRV
jgi:hypothetical protein